MAETSDPTPAAATASTPLNLLLLGAPGSGKGTLAALLIQELGIPHIATGDLFRENLKQNTDLGRLAKSYMDKGALVPDDVTASMVEERLARPDAARGFILDGFPRTLPQAEALESILTQSHRRILGVFYINAPDDLIVARLSARVICRACQTPYNLRTLPPKQQGICDKCGGELYQRDDDKPETVTARLQVYQKQTAPLIDYYTRAGLVHEVEATLPLPEATTQIITKARQLATPR